MTNSSEYEIPEAEEEKSPREKAGIPDEVCTAFVVFVDTSGVWGASSSLPLFDDVVIQREANFRDFAVGGGAVAGDAALLRHQTVLTDVLQQALPQVVQGVLQGQMQMARHMAEQQMAEEIARKTGLTVPPGVGRKS